LDYQSEEEEIEIISQKLNEFLTISKIVEIHDKELLDKISGISGKITRITRGHPNLRRGASIRAGIDLATLVLTHYVNSPQKIESNMFWYDAAEMALSTKIELEESSETTLKNVIHDCVRSVLRDFQ
jgi:hypothetical protein